MGGGSGWVLLGEGKIGGEKLVGRDCWILFWGMKGGVMVRGGERRDWMCGNSTFGIGMVQI